MIHYVLLKFAPGTDLDAAEARVRKTYDELAEALPYLNDLAMAQHFKDMLVGRTSFDHQ